MSVPTQRRTKSSAKRRAAHFALKKQQTLKCSNCGYSILPHRACPKCGHYKGKKVIRAQGGLNK